MKTHFIRRPSIRHPSDRQDPACDAGNFTTLRRMGKAAFTPVQREQHRSRDAPCLCGAHRRSASDYGVSVGRIRKVGIVALRLSPLKATSSGLC